MESKVTGADEAAGVYRLQLCYFAWVRERIGRAEEDVTVPANIHRVGELVAWLVRTDPDTYYMAFRTPEAVRVALDRQHAAFDSPLAGVKSVAFFPPMTGG